MFLMNSKRLLRATNCQKRTLKNFLYLLCVIFAFFAGNFIALTYIDPSQCDIQLCTRKIKQTSVENSNQWLSEWQKTSYGFEKSVFLLILILTAPSNQEQRKVIRDSWLKENRADTAHYFIIGTAGLNENLNKSLHTESKIFRDLLLLETIHDSYKVLSKKLLAALVYANNNIQFRFLLKVDDDTFVNLHQLHLQLKNVPYKQRLYWGFFDGRAKPKLSGQWKETEWSLCDHYLPYALGGGYVISNDLVNFIANNAKYLKLFNSEDISMSVWLAPLDVHKVHEPLFDTEYMSRGCNNKYLITHKQTPSQMKEKYISLLRTGLLCEKEFKVRNSYHYNWNVPPSKCCLRNDSSIP